MNALHRDEAAAADWERLRPLIDDVVHELNDRDREAVLLRFFEGRPFADIGVTLGLSEDAARCAWSARLKNCTRCSCTAA